MWAFVVYMYVCVVQVSFYKRYGKRSKALCLLAQLSCCKAGKDLVVILSMQVLYIILLLCMLVGGWGAGWFWLNVWFIFYIKYVFVQNNIYVVCFNFLMISVLCYDKWRSFSHGELLGERFIFGNSKILKEEILSSIQSKSQYRFGSGLIPAARGYMEICYKSK